ncbi:MAG: UPF0182 family protein, partial [Mycobacterium sp.]|nr:UPF0182 family protein [Mycobacterium sp.]
KAAFALRFGDINPLISDLVTSDSRIIFERDVQTRVEMLAPFLAWDSDPYPVVLDGRIYYVLDGYTTSANYPYSQRAEISDLPPESGLNGAFNYARNSVKATVDAYDGTVKMYVLPYVDDPVIAAWQAAFPSLFTPLSEIPPGLDQHFRYPQDLFRVQTTAFARYHLTDSNQFYEQTNGWS